MKKTERVSRLQDRLREALEVRAMKAIELSEKTGIPKGAISYYLSGKSQPKADRLNQISVALEISEAWLLGYDVPMERTAEQKKNDEFVKIVAKLRKDQKFFKVVSELVDAQTEVYDGLVALMSTLGKK